MAVVPRIAPVMVTSSLVAMASYFYKLKLIKGIVDSVLELVDRAVKRVDQALDDNAEWLAEVVGSPTAYGMTGGGWPSIKSMSLGETVACVLDYDGQAYCGGVRAQVELALMRPPVRLQPERTDLVERGVTFSSLACGGAALYGHLSRPPPPPPPDRDDEARETLV